MKQPIPGGENSSKKIRKASSKMGRRPKNPSEKRSKKVTIALTPAEHRVYTQLAQLKQQSIPKDAQKGKIRASALAAVIRAVHHPVSNEQTKALIQLKLVIPALSQLADQARTEGLHARQGELEALVRIALDQLAQSIID